MKYTVNKNVTVNNVPKSALDPMFPYMVARNVDHQFWYWGSYSTEERARKAAQEVGGEVFTL